MCPGGVALGWGYVLFRVCLFHCPGVLSLGVKKCSSKQFKLGKKPGGLVYRQGKAWAEPWAPKAGWRPQAPSAGLPSRGPAINGGERDWLLDLQA